MTLIGNKPALSSLTIKGAIVVFLPLLLKLFGIDLGADAGNVIGSLVDAGIQFVGLVMVVYGRFRATQTISIDGSP